MEATGVIDPSSEHNTKEKAKARKSGPSLLGKTEELGEKARVFAAAIYWDPTHSCYRVALHLPEGESVPDMNSLIADALSGRAAQRGSQRRTPRGVASRVTKRRRQPPRRSTRLLPQCSAQRSTKTSARRLACCATRRPQSQPSPAASVVSYTFTDSSADYQPSDHGHESDAAGGRLPTPSSAVEKAAAHHVPYNDPGVSTPHEPQPLLSLSEELARSPTGLDFGLHSPVQVGGEASLARDTSWVEIGGDFAAAADVLGGNSVRGGSVDQGAVDKSLMGEGREDVGKAMPDSGIVDQKGQVGGGVEARDTYPSAPARPSPGMAWRELARDCVAIIDRLLSPQSAGRSLRTGASKCLFADVATGGR